MDECERLCRGMMKKKERQEEPRCVFFSDKTRYVKEEKKQRETSQLKRNKIIVKDGTYNEEKGKEGKACKILSFYIGKCNIKATVQDTPFF